VSARETGRRPAGLAAWVIGLALVARSADAAVISVMPDASFATMPIDISFGAGSVVLTEVPGALPGDPPAEVSTTGSDEVSSFLGGVTDFGSGASIDQAGEIYGFSAFAAPAVIPDSAADDFIGVAFSGAGGVHYGYVEVNGAELVGYGYETVADTTILTGAVPEPASIAVFLSGLAGLNRLRRRRLARRPVKDT
jgi:hypothetical protein